MNISNWAFQSVSLEMFECFSNIVEIHPVEMSGGWLVRLRQCDQESGNQANLTYSKLLRLGFLGDLAKRNFRLPDLFRQLALCAKFVLPKSLRIPYNGTEWSSYYELQIPNLKCGQRVFSRTIEPSDMVLAFENWIHWIHWRNPRGLNWPSSR